MKSITIYASTDSGYITGVNANYATAHSTASNFSSADSFLYVGQYYGGGGYYVFRSFLKFPTTDIPANAVIRSAQIRISKGYIENDRSFDVDIIKQDWGAYDPMASSDYDTVFDACLTETKDVIWHSFTELPLGIVPRPGLEIFYSDFLDTSYISSTDYTYYSLRSSRDATTDEPTGFEYIYAIGAGSTNTNYKPALIVSYLELPNEVITDHLYYFLEIDWQGTGLVDSWQDEASRITRFTLDRGRDTVIGGSGSGFEMPNIGKVIVSLDNHDGRFDAWNSSSPLYAYLKPGRRANFSCYYNGTYYDLMTGYISDIRPEGYKETATMVIEDGAGWLNARQPDIPLLDVSDAADAINAILDDMNYPFGRDIDDAVDDLDYYWTSGASGLAEIHKLANSDLGRFCVEADGVAKFRNRHNNESIDHTITEAQIGTNIYLPMPWDYSRSVVDVYTYPRITGTTDSTLWTLNDEPVITAGETMTFWGEYNYSSQPVPATGVFVSSWQPTTAFASTDVVLTAFSRDAKFEMTNTTTDAQTVTELIIKGTPIYSADRIRIREEGTNITDLPATFVMDYEWLTSINTAESFADVLLNYLNDAKQYPEIMIYHRPDIACGIDLEQRLRLVLDTWGIDETFFVSKISHQSGASMQELITTVKLYPMLQDIGTDTFILDSETQGILDTNKLGF